MFKAVNVSVYAITPNLWRWEIRSAGALVRCGTAATRITAESAANRFVNAESRPGS